VDRKNIYDTGLNHADWMALRRAIEPFLHSKNAVSETTPEVPAKLRNHKLIESLRKYKETGDDEYLDSAGRLLFPTEEKFGWYVALTK